MNAHAGHLTVCAIGEHWHLEVRVHQLLFAGGSNLHRVDGITAAQPICIPEDFNRTDYIKRPHGGVAAIRIRIGFRHSKVRETGLACDRLLSGSIFFIGWAKSL
jgi:hypothetical protein